MEEITEICRTILNTKVFIIEPVYKSIPDFMLEPILHMVNNNLEIGPLKKRPFQIDENNTLTLHSIFCKYTMRNQQGKKIIYLSPGYSESSYFMYTKIRIGQNAEAAYLVGVVETQNILTPKSFDVREKSYKLQRLMSKLVYKI